MVAWVVMFRRHLILRHQCQRHRPTAPPAPLPSLTPCIQHHPPQHFHSSYEPHHFPFSLFHFPIYLSPLLSDLSPLFCRFLHPCKTQLFPFHALPHSFTKNKVLSYSHQLLFPDSDSFGIRISPIEDQYETATC